MAETDSQAGPTPDSAAVPMAATAPGPGWYDDPKVPGRRRWWTGSEWGPVQRTATERASTGWTRQDFIPVAMFALGCGALVVAVMLLWRPVFAEGMDCGSLFAPVNPTSQLEGVSGFNAALCSSARMTRMGIVGVIAIAGIALIVGGLVMNKRQRAAVSVPPMQTAQPDGGGATGGGTEAPIEAAVEDGQEAAEEHDPAASSSSDAGRG